MEEIVLSHFQVRPALQARQKGLEKASLSPDLGLSLVEASLTEAGVLFPHGQALPWESAQTILEAENNCFILEGGELRKIQFFSEHTGQVFSLMPTAHAPTMLVSGIPMHRIKDTDPHKDTLEKVKTIRPIVGRVLDTATGLGYTATEAARRAAEVVTIELDPTALEVARLNPWSRELFTNPKIRQIVGDSFEVVAEMEEGCFGRIIHDPPVLSLAGDLYSVEFYQQLHRVLRSRGKLFHYIGDPDSKSGRNTTAGVIRRLQQAGFQNIRRAPRAFGVTAQR